MTNGAGDPGAARQRARAYSASGYFRVRLEHTVRHTQQTTRLIYLVNGGALGLLYFALKELESYRGYVAVIALLVLGAVNGIHARLIQRQGKWYHELDKAFKIASGAEKIPVNTPPGMSSHALHALIHYIISAVLFLAALACLYLEIVP